MGVRGYGWSQMKAGAWRTWQGFRFFFFFGHTHGMQKFLGQESNPLHSSDPSHSTDNTGSLTH